MNGIKNIDSKRMPSDRGQSLVEFTVGLVVLLILVVGIFDAARALFTYLSMRDAAQEGALFASIEPSDTAGIRDRACAASDMVQDLCSADNPANGSGFEIIVSPTVAGKFCMGATGGVAHGMEVTLDHPDFLLTMPLIGGIIGQGDNTVSITAVIIDTIITPSCSP